MDLERVVAEWLPGGSITSIERLSGGDVNDVYRVEVAGGRFVLRIYASETTPGFVRWEHDLLRRLSRLIAEAVAPLPSAGGATFVEVDGRVASLWPFVEGRRAERSRAGDRVLAASMLGRLHLALRELGAGTSRPGHPAWAEMDWREHRLWSWGRADRASIAEHADREDLERVLEELPEAVRELDASVLPSMPVHGDYYADNLLVAGERVVAVLDWDECRVDWRAWEVANAIWAFCRDGVRIGVDRELATEFLERYEAAGGEVLDSERAALPLLMRAGRLYEAMYALGEMQRGAMEDWDYFELQVAAMERLGDLELG